MTKETVPQSARRGLDADISIQYLVRKQLWTWFPDTHEDIIEAATVAIWRDLSGNGAATGAESHEPANVVQTSQPTREHIPYSPSVVAEPVRTSHQTKIGGGSDSPEANGFGYIYSVRKKSRVCHMWDGQDTLCRLWSTGGIQSPSRYRWANQTGGRPVCHMCSNSGRASEVRRRAYDST